MKLVKFKNAYDSSHVYLDLDKLISFKSEVTTNNAGVQIECIDITVGSITYQIRSSIAEICALAEGRDPSPAKILFGDKEDE